MSENKQTEDTKIHPAVRGLPKGAGEIAGSGGQVVRFTADNPAPAVTVEHELHPAARGFKALQLGRVPIGDRPIGKPAIDYSKLPWERGCCPSPYHQRQCQEAGAPLIGEEAFQHGVFEPSCMNSRDCSAEPVCQDFYKAIMAAPIVEEAREQGGRLLGYAMDPTTRQFYAVLILDQRLVRQSTRIAYGE
jgi:hypothetical protein